MFSEVEALDGEMKYIASLLDQVRGKLGDRFLRLELADHLAPKTTPFRVPSGLGEAIDKRIAPAGMGALHLFRAIRDVKGRTRQSRQARHLSRNDRQAETIADPSNGRGRHSGRVQVVPVDYPLDC